VSLSFYFLRTSLVAVLDWIDPELSVCLPQRDKFVASAKSTKIQNETFSDTETDESEEEIEERRQVRLRCGFPKGECVLLCRVWRLATKDARTPPPPQCSTCP
jgi:hypothetical protein